MPGDKILYFFLGGFCQLQEVTAILDHYTLDDFQLFITYDIFSDGLYEALMEYIIDRCMDYLSVK